MSSPCTGGQAANKGPCYKMSSLRLVFQQYCHVYNKKHLNLAEGMRHTWLLTQLPGPLYKHSVGPRAGQTQPHFTLPSRTVPNKLCSPYDAFPNADKDLKGSSGYIKGSCCLQQMRRRKGGKHFPEKQHNTALYERRLHSVLPGLLPHLVHSGTLLAHSISPSQFLTDPTASGTTHHSTPRHISKAAMKR